MNQTPASAQLTSINPHSLAAFDFAFNGTLDPVQVQEIATAAFIGRGENLLLVGGPGTGKTVIAMEVRERATALGLTSEYLCGAGPHSAIEQLIDHGPGYIGSRQSRPGFLEKLLNCDVLVVDDVQRWIEAAPVAFMLLLGRRIELGKANVLITYSGALLRLCVKEPAWRSRSSSYCEHPAFLLGTEPEQRSEWGALMTPGRCLPLSLQLSFLGIDFSVPVIDGEATEFAKVSIAQPNYRRVRSPFANVPVWHKLYTGEKSYREILRRRG